METNEIEVKRDMEVSKAIDSLQAVINSLREGRVHVEHAGESVTLKPAQHVGIQLKARRKEDKESVSVKLSWRPVPAEGEQAELRITSEPAHKAEPAEAD